MDSATLSPPTAHSARVAGVPAARGPAWGRAQWERLALAVLCLLALAGYFAFPTYPTYDSFYALLWGRDLLHVHLPDFSVYRGPTEHPLAIAFGAFCSLFGQSGARLMVFGSIASFVALVAGIYRLSQLCFGPVVAVLAALLMLTRLFDANLAAQGYLDLTYIALIVWATTLEVQRSRRGTAVFVLLAAAGLLRPDAWVLAGVYWLWCAWPAVLAARVGEKQVGGEELEGGTWGGAGGMLGGVGDAGVTVGGGTNEADAIGRDATNRTRSAGTASNAARNTAVRAAVPDRAGAAGVAGDMACGGTGEGDAAHAHGTLPRHAASAAVPSLQRLLGYAALVVLAPLLWVALDTIVTGDPLYSLHSTAVLAAELERTQGFSAVLSATWRYLVRIDKLPVVVGGIVGVALGVYLTPRRARVPLAVLALLLLVYVAEGAGGASVIDRYMMGSAALLLPFCALAIGGWSLLQRGSLLRRAWMAAGAALVLYGALAAVSVTSLTSARTTLAYHDDFHNGLATALHAPSVRAELARCPLLSLPDNKLIPDARWILGSSNQHNIVARSEARADTDAGDPALRERLLRGSVAVYPLGAAVFQEAIVDVGDDPRDQVPLPGFRRIYTSHYYAIYGNC